VRLRRTIVLAGLAVLLTAAAFTYAGYYSDLEAARQRIAIGSEVADTRCGPVEYAALGEGPAVLLVHGAGGGFDQTIDAAHELAGRGFRAIAVSRFGYLRTPQRDDATPEAQADAHACLLDALKIPRAALIGVSAGAPSAMQFALRHPRRITALVLLAPMAWSPKAAFPAAPPSTRLLFHHPGEDFLFWVIARAYPYGLLGTPREVLARADESEKARFRRLALQPLPLSERFEGLLNDALVVTHLQRYELERIAAPTLVISARDDGWHSYEPARYTAQHIRGARFLGLADGGHLWIGHHREVMSEIASFLSSSAR